MSPAPGPAARATHPSESLPAVVRLVTEPPDSARSFVGLVRGLKASAGIGSLRQPGLQLKDPTGRRSRSRPSQQCSCRRAAPTRAALVPDPTHANHRRGVVYVWGAALLAVMLYSP